MTSSTEPRCGRPRTLIIPSAVTPPNGPRGSDTRLVLIAILVLPAGHQSPHHLRQRTFGMQQGQGRIEPSGPQRPAAAKRALISSALETPDGRGNWSGPEARTRSRRFLQLAGPFVQSELAAAQACPY